jgi:hypothetical protein
MADRELVNEKSIHFYNILINPDNNTNPIPAGTNTFQHKLIN